MNAKINNSVKSLDNQAKIDKEKLSKSEANKKPLDRSKPGTDNPANWGEHNKSFNKYCL